jgi:hypothetical protein
LCTNISYKQTRGTNFEKSHSFVTALRCSIVLMDGSLRILTTMMEAVVVYYKQLNQHFPVETEED